MAEHAQRRKYAVIGTGSRGEMYVRAALGSHADVADVVAFVDTNPTRMRYYDEVVSEVDPSHAPVPHYAPDEFDAMIQAQSPEGLIITTPDYIHARYIVRGLELGLHVVVEKPLTIDPASARAINEAAQTSSGSVTMTFNYRYSPRNTLMKQLITDGEIGRPTSVHFEWLLDTGHGADYFRRWHRDKTNSGGLFVHKAAHHFDLVNWWIDAVPQRVYARGGLKFYGQDNARDRGQAELPARGTHDGPHDPFELDLREDPRLESLYLQAEQHDGYHRDQSVFGPGITTEDNLTALVDYSTGVTLTYALHAHGPWEGYRVAVNGTRGRAELEVIERAQVIPRGQEAVLDPSAVEDTTADQGVRSRGERLVVQKHFEAAREVEIPQGSGGHGGGDALMLRDIFEGVREDPWGQVSDHGDGLRAIAVGIGGNHSLETGQPVDLPTLMGVDLRS